MNATDRREPCKIYQFPQMRRASAPGRREADVVGLERGAPVIQRSSAWYHEAAIRSERDPRP